MFNINIYLRFPLDLLSMLLVATKKSMRLRCVTCHLILSYLLMSASVTAMPLMMQPETGFVIKELGNPDGVAIGIKKRDNLDPRYDYWGSYCNAPNDNYLCYPQHTRYSQPFEISEGVDTISMKIPISSGYTTATVLATGDTFGLRSYASFNTRSYRFDFQNIVGIPDVSHNKCDPTRQGFTAPIGVENGLVYHIYPYKSATTCTVTFSNIKVIPGQRIEVYVATGGVRWRYDPEIYNKLVAADWEVEVKADSIRVEQTITANELTWESDWYSKFHYQLNLLLEGQIHFQTNGPDINRITLDPDNVKNRIKIGYNLDSNFERLQMGIMCDTDGDDCAITDPSGQHVIRFDVSVTLSPEATIGVPLKNGTPTVISKADGYYSHRKQSGAIMVDFHHQDIKDRFSENRQLEYNGEFTFFIEPVIGG